MVEQDVNDGNINKEAEILMGRRGTTYNPSDVC
jgi:hypothetical protein